MDCVLHNLEPRSPTARHKEDLVKFDLCACTVAARPEICFLLLLSMFIIQIVMILLQFMSTVALESEGTGLKWIFKILFKLFSDQKVKRTFLLLGILQFLQDLGVCAMICC